MSGTLLFLWLLPRNVCAAVLGVYRAVISPLYGDVCRYHPTCSAYALQAIQQRGVVRGVWLGSRRIVRCHPWAEGGIDDVPVYQTLPISRFGFVLPGAVQVRATDVLPRTEFREVVSGPPIPILVPTAVSIPVATPSTLILLNHGKA